MHSSWPGRTSFAACKFAPMRINRPGRQRGGFRRAGRGLCRTEHMFFEGDRIDAVREMILADTKEGRETAVAKLLPYQRGDFAGIFRSLNGLPATIRLLDPPCTNSCRTRTISKPNWPANSACRLKKSRAAWPNCTNSTRCSDCVAAALASSFPKSRACNSRDF